MWHVVPMVNSRMATETEVEGETTVSVPEEVEQALSQEPAPESEEQTPPQEDESSSEPEGEVTPEAAVTPPTESQPSLSPRGEKRFGKLLDKLKDRTVENSELKRALEGQGVLDPNQADLGSQVPQVRAPWEQENPFSVPQPGSELTPEDYARNVTQTADQIVNLRLGAFAANMKRAETISKDREDLEGEYPILNPAAEEYDPNVSKNIAQLYLEAQKTNPDLRLKTFVSRVMSVHQAGQVQGKKEVTPKLIQQQAEAAVTPSGAGQKTKSSVDDWESLSTTEKEEWLRQNGAWD